MGVVDSIMYVFCCWWCGCQKKEPLTRLIKIGVKPTTKFLPNIVRHQKYNIFTFLPMVLYEQFKFFLNFYFLVMALSQLIPSLKVGYLYSYWVPLGFVITATIIREAVDEVRRWKRDKEVNSQKYSRLIRRRDGVITSEFIPSSNIAVGDLIEIEKDQRVPADLLLLRTTEKSGTCFIRTDQLDGETDWKLRVAIPETQKLECNSKLFENEPLIVFAEKPLRDVYIFIGTISENGKENSLNIEHTLWANTVLAAGKALGLVVYTGKETRSWMNNSQPRSKTGLLDLELNTLTKILFFANLGLSLVMMVMKGFSGPAYGMVYLFRFLLLFSYIIPLSLRLNVDFAKVFYSYQIGSDRAMPGCVVRCTTIPEELGRISYLLSDKTGTLTKNSMKFKKLHLGRQQLFTVDDTISIREVVKNHFLSLDNEKFEGHLAQVGSPVANAILAMALCHNVTPVTHKNGNNAMRPPLQSQLSMDIEYWATQKAGVTYQASSPDEIALVTWADAAGLALSQRDLYFMQLTTPLNDVINFSILQLFPFTSESKRMGIIVQNEMTKEIIFYVKGADVAMKSMVIHEAWMDEEVTNMAREGLRTLVMAKKAMTQEEYDSFEAKYSRAKTVTSNRSQATAAVITELERNMELICVTGVEDELQSQVKETLETLRSAGIKVWMLTGDKLETAVCIAKSSNLVSRGKDNIFVFGEISSTNKESRTEVHDLMKEASEKPKAVFIITGTTLECCLRYYKAELLDLFCGAPCVVVCRCSPTQKSQVVELIKKYTKKRTAAIGDGGNDVGMIQAADVGIGIAGKEGKQASLAADFSITEFSSLQRLFLIHGRWSYKRSATLSLFIIHRGLLITVMQAIFSTVFYFSSVSLFPGAFMVGYATIFTLLPVFSLVLDKDFKEDEIALTFPLLYVDLAKGRCLSFKTFFIWVLISVIQGAVLMYSSLLVFETVLLHIVAIAYTALILTELIMVAITVTTWHYLIIVAEVFSLILYFTCLFIFRDWFDPAFFLTLAFASKVTGITLLSCLPVIIVKILCWRFSPSIYSKLS